MFVTIRAQRGITLDVNAEPVWEASGGQAIGSARLRIPRNSQVWDSEYINEDGGMLVDIQTPAGLWRGISGVPAFSPDGMEITAQHIMAWAKLRHVGNRTFAGVTAGDIVRRCVQDALGGLASVPVTLGPILVAPPVIGLYTTKGQSLLSVLTDMQNQTGQAWVINDLLQFVWVQQVGKYREATLIDDGRFLTSLSRTALSEQFAEDIEVEQSGRTFTAYDRGVPALWPSQRITRI